MNVLLIDRALPSSVYSGKTLRLRHIYGQLAKEINMIYLRIAQHGEENESEELESWARKTFRVCLRAPSFPKPTWLARVRTAVAFRPWYDIVYKYSETLDLISDYLDKVVKQYDIDCVVTFDNDSAPYGFLLSRIKPWIQDPGDSMVLQLRRQLKHVLTAHRWLALYWRLCREVNFEREMAKKAHCSIFVADEDASKYRSLCGERIRVIPNGVDTDYFNPDLIQPIRDERPYVVFTGHMSFVPNQDAARWFSQKILPTIRTQFPNLGFKIVGADPAQSVRRLGEIAQIEVTGAVDDIRPYLKGATALVCPMRMGCGIKNKLLEAMAMELPIVATPLAVRGIRDIPVPVVRIAPEGDFGNLLGVVLKTRSQGDTAGKQARAFVQRYFSWEETLNEYKQVFRRVVGKLVFK